MNHRGILAIYNFEMTRAFRTIGQTIASPVISTALYFIVFGSTMGTRIGTIDTIHYGAFITPGLVMLAVLGQSISNASFGIYFPRYTGTIYEILSAPLSSLEIISGYVGAATTKSIIIGIIVLVTSICFVPIEIKHPLWMIFFLIISSVTFSLLGFIIGIWADGFDKLQMIPLLIVTPLTFLGGSFYSIRMLPNFWQKISLLNPMVYLISGFRWSFYESADVDPLISITVITIFLILCMTILTWIFRTGYKLKQ